MNLTDFNINFTGFCDNEDILVDTGVILAYLNKYDTWSKTITELFDNYIFNDDNIVCLYINSAILNEITNLINKPVEQYIKKHKDHSIGDNEITKIEKESIQTLKQLIENEILILLDSNKESTLKQLELYKDLGAADAVNVSIVNEYGISFLTVDNKLVSNIKKRENDLSNINNVYYTTNENLTY